MMVLDVRVLQRPSNRLITHEAHLNTIYYGKKIYDYDLTHLNNGLVSNIDTYTQTIKL